MARIPEFREFTHLINEIGASTAKRYLCAVEPDYYASLSEASKRSLALQGDPFDRDEAEKFMRRPFAREAVRIRRWDDLAAGQSVIANVSRTVIGHAGTRYQPISVVSVTAPPHILERRLAGRGRERAADQADRLTRVVTAELEGDDTVTIINDGPLADAAERFIDFLEPLARGLPANYATS